MLDFVQTETLLVRTFGDLIKDPSLAPDDNLREKGLGSLQCVAGAMLLRKHGIKVKPQELVRYDTVRALTNHLCTADLAEHSSQQVAGTEESFATYSMTPTQRDWQQAGFNEHYNIYGGWSYHTDTFSRSIFAEAVQHLVNSQEELRLRISKGEDGLLLSSVSLQHPPYLETIDLSHLSTEQARAEATETCCGLQRAFRFDGKTPLCRFIDFRLDKQGNGWIFIIVHHFTVDGFGWGNLLRKISHVYSCLYEDKEPFDIYGGSGVSRLWSEALKLHGQTTGKEELPYWQSLPWEALNCNLRDSLHCPDIAAPTNVFNDEDAVRLHELETRASIDTQSMADVFESQATVLGRLDSPLSRCLLENAWRGAELDEFDDFDLFSAAAVHALAPYCRKSHLWLDMLAATRSGVFEDIDASGSLGYFSELTPFVAPVSTRHDLRKTARAIAAFRAKQPRSGVGFRALKTHANEPEIQNSLAAMRRPQVGINYHASLLYAFSGTMLDLPKVPDWLGPTMDENGIRYRFWYRVSFGDGCLQMMLRYNPSRYCIKDGLAVANGTLAALRDFLFNNR